MRELKIGRIFGISIEIHWSWYIIFVLITLSLGMTFTKFAEGLIPWLIAILTSLVFFGSILFHELAHSFVALKQKIQVKKITLLIFGGVAQIQKTSESPGKEIILAIVGPLSSLFLAGIFFLFLKEAVQNNWPAILMAPIYWLFWINLMVGIFNSIPAYPMDGGRVFQAIIWAIKKDWFSSVKIACQVTNFICWGSIILSVYLVFFKGMAILAGFWLLIIALFINGMAKASYRQALILQIFGDLKVKEIMVAQNQSDAQGKIFCHPEEKIVDILPKFLEFKTKEFLVKDDGEIVGKITLEELDNYLKDKLQKTRV